MRQIVARENTMRRAYGTPVFGTWVFLPAYTVQLLSSATGG